VPNSPGHTNPTSGGPAGRRSHTIGAGDTLHSIAQREYGKPGLWRGLADVNGIDDPLRVAVGTSVLIPPREDVENRS
jgi:nucleoid-associated protein YgaU